MELMRIKKIVEPILVQGIAVFSPKIAKMFAFRKSVGITFTNIQNKQAEVELLLLPYLLSKDSVFIDIGANKGLYSFYSEEIISKSNIIAFEPVPQLAKMLRKLFPSATIVQKGLSDEKGEATLKIPIHPEKYLLDTRSTLEDDPSDSSMSFKEVSIDITTLDDYISSNKLEDISLIKIDVEGHEMKVLSGAKNVLINKRPNLIVEIETANHNDQMDDIFRFITDLEYSIYYFDLNTISLIEVYKVGTGVLIPIDVLQKNHNYICFPNEKYKSVEVINKQLIASK